MDIIGIVVLVISFFFLLVVGVPVAYSIGVAGILTMFVNRDSLLALTTYAMRMASGLDSFALLAIPFFILAGDIMKKGGIWFLLTSDASAERIRFVVVGCSVHKKKKQNEDRGRDLR